MSASSVNQRMWCRPYRVLIPAASNGHRRGHQHSIVSWRKRQCDESNQGHAHADDERVGFGMPVGIRSNHRLKDRANHLKGQRDQPDLGKTQAERLLEQGIDGRKQRLDGVVEQMAEA